MAAVSGGTATKPPPRIRLSACEFTKASLPHAEKALDICECSAFCAFRDILPRTVPPLTLAVRMDLVDLLAQRATALTVADVASLLNISERQVYKLAADGRIPCFKIGNSIRFDPATFAAWLQKKISPASADTERKSGVRRA